MFPDILSENNYRSILSGVFDGIKTTKIIVRIVFFISLFVIGVAIRIYL